MVKEELERNYIKEAAIVIPCIFAGVWLFGKTIDTLFGGKEKAEEARKAGYDI